MLLMRYSVRVGSEHVVESEEQNSNSEDDKDERKLAPT